MIRNNREYMLADGSPRYGIRTTGLVVVAEAPARSLATVEQTADAAAMLDGAELKMAAQHRYVLDKFTQDAATIASVRLAHPDELKVAEQTVAKRLGSPAIWIRGARSAYNEVTVDEAEKEGTLHSQLALMLMSIGLSVVCLVILFGMMVVGVPPLPFLGIAAALWLILLPVRRKLDRKLVRTTLPYDIRRDEAQVFWDDVVNATLLTVLRHKGVAVDIATSGVLTRGWNHTRYVASVAQELRTNHKDTAGA